MTPRQIRARIAELEAQQEAATHWGAAVGARHEELNLLYRNLRQIERANRTTPSDRVAAYFERITGRPMTRAEKIPLAAIIAGDEPHPKESA